MTNHEPFTISDALAAHTLITATSQNARVNWLDDRGKVQEGTARALVHAPGGGGFLASTADIREGYVWITSALGFEIWPSVVEVLAAIKRFEWVLA